MKTPKNQTPFIILPSFLRRVLRAYALKSLIRAQGCELNRIGRSRNWQLKASFEQLEATIAAISDSEEPSWQWLATHLAKQSKNLAFDVLVGIAKKKPGITVSELMQRTDCTIAQARRVIDTIEFDD
ncbi:Ribosome recycling factor [Colwellia chukchiensis]|uniref:Ribosome recycling factor n=1 Tax=Colwellia chukchiensis TaxID=641665 RepID=A0A1H7GCZ7_9GAMM|nr:ribosome recycling factor family protein [Colwellia chukchiensis]SEK35367.1 Ribosome recycling factor [Colwellia chukchiensis]